MIDITIRKGNTELTVPEDQKSRYLSLGYSVYEGNKLVEEAPTQDVGVLQTKVASLMAENEKLKAEIAKLKPKKTATKVKE